MSYNPVFLASLEYEEPIYSFNRVQVMTDPETCEVLFGEDSGWSCPSPFESFTTKEDWHTLQSHQFDRFKEHVRSRNDAATHEELTTFFNTVKDALDAFDRSQA